jgi:2-succinyl-5-enolpyruvyl-6-hydroxy-3-cyclohexene-1-carboxylate synthase
VNPSTALARVLVDELVRGGLTEMVLAPGSRSAPLAFALHAAATEGRLRLHVRIDERSAGFLALGLARSRGVAAVVTTSGTAVANLHPVVLEAHHAGVPMVVLSADRPGELRGVGANQTVDQVGIFGRSVRLFHEIAAPDDRPGQVAYWRATASRAVLTARGSLSTDPGPVHVNVALREPLVPSESDTWVESLDGRDAGRPWTEARPDAESAATVGGPARTLVVVGDAPVAVQRAAVALGKRRGWPVIAEPTAAAGGPDVVRCGPLVVAAGAWLAEHEPDRILVVGRPTLSRPVSRLLTGGVAPVEAVSATPWWPDTGHAVRAVYSAAALAVGDDDPGDPAFLAAWRKAGERARTVVEAVLAEYDVPTGLAAARIAVEALPPESLLYLGSSSVVRDVDVAGTSPLPAEVHANRGVSGIDGTVSAAIGAALGRPGRPSYALLGDLTFLHDANGLVVGPHEPRPDLCVVVVNDDGGGIFALLEQGAPEHAGVFERVFGTPHGTDLGALCAATGTPHQRVSLDELPAALAPRPGLRVVEVAVDRSVHRDLHARLHTAVATALTPSPR